MQWIIIIALFCSASLSDVYTDDKQRFKRQEDRWAWGNAEVTENNQPNFKTSRPEDATTTTTTATTPEPTAESCKIYNPPVPNFRAPGRRISEAKCYEYIWQLKKRVDINKRDAECREYNRRRYNVYYVLGGRFTTPGEFPHLGAIGWKAVVGTWIFKCGSSLISPKYVLTAAHCTRASSRDPTIADVVPKIVRLGDKNIIDIKYKNYPPIDADIVRIISHPQYASPKKYYDIAIMELKAPVKFSKLVQPACLWGSFATGRLGENATLTGWGVVESGSLKISPELRAATVDIIDSQQCDQLLTPSCNRHWCGMQDHQLCAGKLAGGVDACQGDSGGPLQVKIPLPTEAEGSMHRIIGVTSFGIGCGLPNLPGIYTRVSSFIDWIEDIVWKGQ